VSRRDFVPAKAHGLTDAERAKVKQLETDGTLLLEAYESAGCCEENSAFVMRIGAEFYSLEVGSGSCQGSWADLSGPFDNVDDAVRSVSEKYRSILEVA
jgi:hypothetical protein